MLVALIVFECLFCSLICFGIWHEDKLIKWENRHFPKLKAWREEQ